MTFLRKLKAALGVPSSPATPRGAATREAPLFVYIKMPAHIEPLDRATRFEDPLQASLDAAALGEITGGGSQLSEANSECRRHIESCGIDVDLYDVEQGLALLRRELVRLQAPPGTVLLNELGGRTCEQGVYEA